MDFQDSSEKPAINIKQIKDLSSCDGKIQYGFNS
jgi:hypothetical protein